MSNIPAMTGKRMISALKKAGFTVARIKGSHHFLIYYDGRRTVIPVHGFALFSTYPINHF